MARVTRHNCRRSVAIIEFAIALPLLLLLVLGMIELGWALLKSQQITNAARQGARVGARVGAVNADVSAAVAAMMNAANMSGLGEPTIDPPDVSTLPGGVQFMVTVSVPYSDIGLGMLPVAWLPMPANLQAHVTMSKEGYNPPP